MSDLVDREAEEILAEANEPPQPPIRISGIRCSKETGELVAALALAQLKFEPVRKEMNNPYYSSKYADLALIIAGTQKALAENGLVVLQFPETDISNRKVIITSRLAHKSGQWFENQLELPAEMKGKDGIMRFDPQSCGSAITYGRRYSYQPLVGVAAEWDDDGNAASGLSGSKEAAQAVAKRKVDEYNAKKATVPAIFYTWFDQSETAEITGSTEILKANEDLLKPFVTNVAGKRAIVVDGDQLETLKHEFEVRKIEFRQLKAA